MAQSHRVIRLLLFRADKKLCNVIDVAVGGLVGLMSKYYVHSTCEILSASAGQWRPANLGPKKAGKLIYLIVVYTVFCSHE